MADNRDKGYYRNVDVYSPEIESRADGHKLATLKADHAAAVNRFAEDPYEARQVLSTSPNAVYANDPMRQWLKNIGVGQQGYGAAPLGNGLRAAAFTGLLNSKINPNYFIRSADSRVRTPDPQGRAELEFDELRNWLAHKPPMGLRR